MNRFLAGLAVLILVLAWMARYDLQAVQMEFTGSTDGLGRFSYALQTIGVGNANDPTDIFAGTGTVGSVL